MTNLSEPMRGELIPAPNPTTVDVIIDGLPPRSERLRTLNDVYGITGHSPTEIYDEYYLTTKPRYQRGGGRDYVADIAKSQGRHAYEPIVEAYEEMTRTVFHSLTLARQIDARFIDPEGRHAAETAANQAGLKAARHATMGITENFLDFLNDAHLTIGALDTFDESITEDNVDQDMKYSELLNIENELKENKDARRAIGAITRYVEGFLFSRNAGEDYTTTDYMSDDETVLSREIETVGEIDIRFLREIIKIVRALELGRKNFWTVQLIGRPADEETGVPMRRGVNSINDTELREHIATSLGKIHRGDYKPVIET